MTSPPRMPLLVVAADDPAERGLIEEELERRYGSDYTIRICTTAELEGVLDQAEANGDDVAVALASGKEGADLLARMRGRFPTARRGLLIPWLGWSRRGVGELVLRSMARGWIDLYVIAPTRRRDEVFHRTISELLQESERLRGEGPAGRDRRRRRPLCRAGARAPREPGRARDPPPALAAADGEAPAVTLADGQVLADPDPAELTRALGFPTELDSHEADLVVVGAGPAGLSAAVYGASEGLRTTVLDAGAVGGQAGSSSLIRNYLGFPRGLGGGELAQRAYQQAWLFGAQFRLTHRADGARAARRQAHRPHRERRRDRRARGRARARGRVPAARSPRPDRAGGRGRVLRRLDVGGPGAGRRERLHRRRRQLGRAGGAAPRPLRLQGQDPRPRRGPGGDDVAVPDRHDRQGPERAGADADRGGARRSATAASRRWSCAHPTAPRPSPRRRWSS